LTTWMAKIEKSVAVGKAQQDAAGNGLEALTELLQEATQKAEKATTNLEEIAERRMGQGASTGEGTGAAPPTSYAEALRKAPAGHANTVARVEMLRRQVVINKADAEGADPFQGLTKKEVVVKTQ
jgi:hypothetical protein